MHLLLRPFSAYNYELGPKFLRLIFEKLHNYNFHHRWEFLRAIFCRIRPRDAKNKHCIKKKVTSSDKKVKLLRQACYCRFNRLSSDFHARSHLEQFPL